MTWRPGLLAALMAAAIALPASAQIEMRAGERVNLSGDLAELALAAGGEVDVVARSTDDVFAAGGNVRYRGANADGLYGAGGRLTFDDITARDLTIAGGEIDLTSGTVADDLVAAGGRVDMEQGFSVAGSAVISGGDVSILGSVSRELRATGGRVEINASVGGDATVEGNEVTIGPNARIGGNLVHRASKIDISPQAQITGSVTALPPRPNGMWDGGMDAGDWIGAALFGIAMLVVLSCAAVLLLPGLMRDADRLIRERPLTTLGLGLLIAIAAPVGLTLLAVTVIGLPVAFVLLMLLLATLPLAIAAFVHFAGMQARSLFGRGSGPPSLGARLGWTVLAAVVLALVGLIPWIGWLVWLAAYLFGLGAVATQGARALFRGAGEPPFRAAPA